MSSHPQASLLISSLKSEHPTMMQAWYNEQYAVTRELVEQCHSSFVLRLPRQDEGSAWCIKQMLRYVPDLYVNTQKDTLAIAAARYLDDGFWDDPTRVDMGVELFGHPASLHLTNVEGENAMLVAAEEGKLFALNTLLEKGADISAQSVGGESIVKKAKKSHQFERILSLILQHLAKNGQPTEFMEQELRELFYDTIAGDGWKGKEKMTLVQQLRPFAKDLKKEAIKAIGDGNSQVVKVLLDMGLDPQATDDQGQSWIEQARSARKGELMGIFALAQSTPRQS